MDLRALLILLGRRWLVTVPLLLLTALLVVLAIQRVEPRYEATGSVLLVGPAGPISSEGIGVTNPLLDFTRSLDTTGAVLVGILSDPDQARTFATHGLSDDFTVALDSSAPIVTFSARSKDSNVAIVTVRALFDAVDKQLIDRQKAVGAPPVQYIRAQPLAEPLQARALQIDRIRAALAIAAAGLMSTVIIVLAVERFRTVQLRTSVTDASDPLTEASLESAFRATKQTMHPLTRRRIGTQEARARVLRGRSKNAR